MVNPWDKTLLHKLVKKQRYQSLYTTALQVNGGIITGATAICEAFADVYEKLATPSYPEQQLDWLLEHMRHLAALTDDTIQVSPAVMTEIIKDMKSGKALDREGYKAEHLKLLARSSHAILALTTVVNKILGKRASPDILKAAYKIPIPK